MTVRLHELVDEEPSLLGPVHVHLGVRHAVISLVHMGLRARIPHFGILLIQEPDIALLKLNALIPQPLVHSLGRPTVSISSIIVPACIN